MAPQTRERVLTAIRELRYRPTAFDSNQESSTKQIAFIVEEQGVHPLKNNLYVSTVLDGVWETCAINSWSVGLYVERQWDDVGGFIRRNFDGRCDGIILIAPNLENPAPRQFAERGLPLVAVGRERPMLGVNTVDIANETAAAEWTRRLLDLGHRQLAFFSGFSSQESSHLRAMGFARAVVEAGLPRENVRIFLGEDLNSRNAVERLTQFWEGQVSVIGTLPAHPSDSFVASAFEQLDADGFLPTAALCWNDELASQVGRAALQRGLRIPEDLSIVGFDANDLMTIDGKRISSVAQPLYEMGKQAARLIVEQSEDQDQPVQNIRVPSEPFLGETVAPPPTR